MSESASMTTHLFSYRFGGAEWSLEIQAESPREARERLNCLGLARYEGEVVTRVSAVAGPLARLAVWFRNVKRKS
jgi:hypothetical protein